MLDLDAMGTSTNHAEREGNRLLAALPAEENARMRGMMEHVRPRIHDVLYAQWTPIEYVYFPDGGVFSLLAEVRDGSEIEVGTIDNEGMIGLPVFHGARIATERAICQLTGPALRMSAALFREVVTPEHPLHRMMHLYT